MLKQRLDRPFIKKDGKLIKATWAEAYALIAEKINGLTAKEMAAIAGDLVDVESMLALKDLFSSLGVENLDCRQNNEKLEITNRSDYLFNTSIAGIENADFCLIIGSNPRKEAAILNARIRKSTLKGMKVALIGKQVDLAYQYDYLGDSLEILLEILAGNHPIARSLKGIKRPMLILGSQVTSLEDGAEIITLCKLIAEKYNFISGSWNGFNILHTAAARVGGLDIAFVPKNEGYNVEKILENSEKGQIKLVYLLGADEIDLAKLNKTFVIYQGHHGDKAAHIADVILPGCAYTEKNATYVNLEGRVQRSYRAVYAPGEAKQDFQIIIELAQILGKTLEYNDLNGIRAAMIKIAPHFANVNAIEKAVFIINKREFNCKTKVIDYNDSNYYLTDPISRASVTMSKAASAFGREDSACKC